SMGIINSSRGKLAPASVELRSEVEIVCGLASEVERLVPKPLSGSANASQTSALGTTRSTSIPWREFAGNYDLIRERIARVVPGFENYNVRVREGAFYLPNAPRDRREWRTKSGHAN